MTVCANSHDADETCPDCRPEVVDDRVKQIIDRTRALLRSSPPKEHA